MKTSNRLQGRPGTLHSHPDSFRQLALQPSPLTTLPSSQVSPVSTDELPQECTQTPGSPAHAEPGSVLHFALQPLPEIVSPSSHSSSGSRLPLPQLGVHTLGCPRQV